MKHALVVKIFVLELFDSVWSSFFGLFFKFQMGLFPSELSQVYFIYRTVTRALTAAPSFYIKFSSESFTRRHVWSYRTHRPCPFSPSSLLQWTRSLKVFCKESSSVKDRLHHCCKRSGNNVFSCFNSEAVNPHYQPTEEIPAPPLTSTPNFNFDPSTCQGYF